MILPKKKDDLVDFLVEQYRKVRDELAPQREKWSTYWALFNSYVDTDSYPLPFQTFVPLPWSIAQTIAPRIEHSLLQRKPLFQVGRGDPTTPQQAVASLSRLENDEWFADNDTQHSLSMMALEGIVVGTTPAFVEYRHIQKKQAKQSPFDAGAEGTFAVDGPTETVDVINRPVLVHRDMFDVYPDLQHETQGRMRFVFDVCVKSMDEIRATAEEFGYENLDALEEDGDWKREDLDSYSRRRAALVGEVGSGEDGPVDVLDDTVWPDSPRHVLTCTIRTYEKDPATDRTLEVIRLVTIGNEGVLLRNIVIPYWPWLFWRNNPIPGSFLGRSDFQPVEGLFHSVNNTVNMIQTNMLGSISMWWFLGDDAEVDPDTIALDPFSVITGGNVSPETVRMEHGPPMNRDAMTVNEMLRGGINEGVGMGDVMRGQSAPRKEYVSTNMMQSQAAEARIDKKIKDFSREVLVPAANLFLACARHHMEEPVMVEDPSSPMGFSEVDRFVLQFPFKFKIAPAAIGIKEMQRAAVNDALGTLNQLIPMVPPEHPLFASLMKTRFRLGRGLMQTFDGEAFEDALGDFDDAISLLQQGPGAAGPTAAGGPPAQPAGPQPPGPAGMEGLAGLLGGAPAFAGAPGPSFEGLGPIF